MPARCAAGVGGADEDDAKPEIGLAQPVTIAMSPMAARTAQDVRCLIREPGDWLTSLPRSSHATSRCLAAL